MHDKFIGESDDRMDENSLCYYLIIIANRWLSTRLEMIANFIILFSALFAVIYRETMDASQVGLIITYALSSTSNLNWLVRVISEMETKYYII